MITRVLLASFCMLGGSLWLAIDTTRDYLHQQLNAYAQDSANSLALALQPHMSEENLLTAETMITALVQSGHYSAIELRDSSDSVLVEHHLGTVRPQVPELFLSLLPLQPPAANAAINDGWDLVARVYVSAHPGVAYQQLWRLTQGIAGLGLAGAALAVALALRWSKRKQQLLAEQLQSLNQEIEALRRETLQDEQTGLGNRRAFERQLQGILAADSTASSAKGKHLLLIHLSSLADTTRSLGRWAADDYIETVITLLRHHFSEHLLKTDTGSNSIETDSSCLFRAGDGVLALLGSFGSRDAVCALSQGLCDEFSTHTTALHPHGFGSIGIVPIEATQTVHDILYSGDIALHQAERTGVNQWCYLLNRAPYLRVATKLETSE